MPHANPTKVETEAKAIKMRLQKEKKLAIQRKKSLEKGRLKQEAKRLTDDNLQKNSKKGRKTKRESSNSSSCSDE